MVHRLGGGALAAGAVSPCAVYTSVRAGWWVVWSMGGRGTFKAAVSSAVISSSWVSFSSGTARVKPVSPPWTKVALVALGPADTLTVPVMPVTVASSRAGTDWLKWPPYTGRSTSWRVSAMHSEAMTPLMLPRRPLQGGQFQVAQLPVGFWQGVGNLVALQGHRPAPAQGVHPGEGEGGQGTVQAHVVALGLPGAHGGVEPHAQGPARSCRRRPSPAGAIRGPPAG